MRWSEGSKCGLCPGRQIASSPLSPSTITARASASEDETSAIRASGLAWATIRTHSAPDRVLPNPRPAMIIQMRQSPSGGNWSGRAV
jgi:hypothetical protein